MLVFEEDNREQVLQAFQNIQEGLRKYSQATKQTDITISGGMERVMRQINRWICCLLLQIVAPPQKIIRKNRIVE